MDASIREVIDKCEWVAIATTGPDGPHLAATWGDYVRALGVENDVVLIPAGGLRKTEANLKANPRIELLLASRQVQRPQGSGQGCVLSGTGEMQTSSPSKRRIHSSRGFPRKISRRSRRTSSAIRFTSHSPWKPGRRVLPVRSCCMAACLRSRFLAMSRSSARRARWAAFQATRKVVVVR